MDASASPSVDADITEVYGFFLQIEDSSFSNPFKSKNTVIKYTKLPDFDLDAKVSWPDKCYTLQPRLRRLITLDDSNVVTSRSLKPNLVTPLKTMSSTLTRRKIVTIAEDEENDLHPRFGKDRKSSRIEKSSTKSIDTDYKSEKQSSQRTTSRLTSSSKYGKEIKASAKNAITANRKEVTASKTQDPKNHRHSNVNTIQPSDNSRVKNNKEKDLIQSRSTASSRISISKNIATPRESENALSVTKNKIYDTLKSKSSHYKSHDRPRLNKSPQESKSSAMFRKEIRNQKKPVNIIRVPLDDSYINASTKEHLTEKKMILPVIKNVKCKVTESTEKEKSSDNVSKATSAVPITVDKLTQFDGASEMLKNAIVQTEIIKEAFDSLHIPNVSLTKDKNESKENADTFYSKSLPNLQIPATEITPHKSVYNKKDNMDYYESSSYVIGHATVTCTTEQKINIHVVGSNNESSSNQSPSPLAYPLNVLSIYEKEINKKRLQDAYEHENKSNAGYTNCVNELKSFNCSYVFNSNKLVKPSDIISSIRVSNGILQSDYVCEQFERELNFIDSFFESLQYLESSYFNENCLTESKIKSWINNSDYGGKTSDYGNFLSKLENGSNVDDTETMASKSLCLLNLLIRDEQRRAKNLLFVLKMREDALKDFTKSQILWLENKKKQDNTDISTLKKKQRGALLKLQHECGEMQRMRKALLTQSEKRKVVLMKTKKNIELTLKKNVDVDQIILGKKKLKRSTNDRNIAPLKCFDLASSGCDESSASRPKSITPLPEASANVTNVTSAEKCIQTNESVLGTTLMEQSTDTAAENFVVVDGGYLNILFHNLSKPQIFSSGKQYEVNEEALRSIVNSSNTHHTSNDSDVIDKFMNQIKNSDLDLSSPSTARSLVEEMDQYYKGLIEEEKSFDSSDRESNLMSDMKNVLVQTAESKTQSDNRNFQSASTMTSDSNETVVDPDMVDRLCVYKTLLEADLVKDQDALVVQTGPLPVPAGEAASGTDTPAVDTSLWNTSKSSTGSISDCSSVSSDPLCASTTSMSLMTSPVCEAEELRRQQLAIEREIKALEQQQCQLLVVREIPDKPPPPYTPPAEAKVPRPPRMYVADETTEEKIQRYIKDPNSEDHDPTDAFDTFVKDFCMETLEKQTLDRSDKPWDSCNLLPQKPVEDMEKVMKKTSSHLLEILAGVTPTYSVSGVGGRRSDHIDDILFAEWRRCEPEWTSLHTDETLVKNQIFESIFQKILTETVDEYKRTVLCNK